LFLGLEFVFGLLLVFFEAMKSIAQLDKLVGLFICRAGLLNRHESDNGSTHGCRLWTCQASSPIQHPTSNIQHPTQFEWAKPSLQKQRVARELSSPRCSIS
jgi:hypothetical protein